MVDVSLNCPYCGTTKVAFRGDKPIPCDAQGSEYIILLQCRCCRNGVVAKYRGSGIMNWISTGGLSDPPPLLESWPKMETVSAPKYLPDNIRSFYTQGIDSLRRQNYDAAGTMFRKSLDVTLKRLYPEGKGTLQKRIDALPHDLGITPAMKEWAHEIRDLGNDAAHEDEPFTESEARALQAFIEMFLTYAFTLPGMLKERKSAEPPV